MIGMMVVLAVLAALPAVAFVANSSSTEAGRSTDTSFEASAKGQYCNGKNKDRPSCKPKPKKAKKCKASGGSSASVGGVVANGSKNNACAKAGGAVARP